MTIEFGDGDSVDVPGVGPVIGSEFAQVSVTFRYCSAILRVCAWRTFAPARVRFLDALELETIIWLSDERLTALLDPSDGRWRGDT